MKQAEYFRRAATDATFRKAEIEKHRYIISSGKVMFWFLGTPLIVFSLYCAFTGSGPSVMSEVILMLLTGTVFDMWSKTNLGALEALENPQPSPASEKVPATSLQR